MAEDTQINVGMNVDGVATGVNKAKTELRSLQAEVDKVAALSKKGGDALGKLPEGVDAAKAAKALTSISNGIKRVSEEAVLGRNSVELFTAKFEKAGISKEVYKPIIDAYGQVRTQVDLANGAFTQSGKVLNEYGMGAKATAAALRQVPAQLTDIVVSLQGGQAPLTVFLQQGGQLRDVFGSASGALRAMAGTLVKLINPFTLAAGAVAVLGLAYKQATDEVDVYRKALVLSGNDMGLSIGGLQRMAESIGATSGTVGAAAKALGVMAGSSNVAAGGLEKATLAAIRFEKYAGVAIKDTAKAFADLANEPVQASERLNNQYNYLTASIYSQIKALEEQGNKAGAVALAQDELANAQNRMSADLEAGLGRIEQAWDLAGKAASFAWDKFVGLGRPDPIEKVIAELETRMSFGNGFYGVGQDKAKLQEQLDYWKHIKASQDDYAANQKRIAEQTGAQISLDKAWESGLGKVERANRAIAKLSGEFAKADQTPENQAKYAAAIQNILKGAEEKVKVDKAGNRELEKQAELLLTLSGYSKDYSEDVQRLVVMRQKGTLNEEAYLRAVNELVAKQPLMVALNKENAAAIKLEADATIAASVAHSKQLESLDKGVEKLKDSVKQQQDHNDSIGAGKVAIAELEAARLQEQATIVEGIAIKQLDKNLDYAQYELYKAQAAELRNLANLKVAGAQKQVGYDAAQDMAKEQKKAAEESSKYWEDALMRAFESGKGFFESLWSTIKNTLKTQVLKVLVTGSMTGMSALASAATGGASDSVLGYVNGASNLNTLYGAGSQLMFGSAAGASTASLLGANAVGALGGDSLGALIALNGGWAGVATGTTAAGAAGSAAAGGEALAGLSSTGYGVIIAAAIAAIMYITKQGETRFGATYKTGADGKAVKAEGPSGGEIAGDLSKSIFDSTQASINATLKAVGSAATISGFTAGLESSENGKGFAFAGGTVNGVGVGEYKGRNGGQFTTKDMTPQQAMEAYVAEMNQVTLEALQAATDIPALVSNELKGIDIGKLTAAEVGELTKTVQTVIASVNVFNDSLKTLPFESLWNLSFKTAAGLVEAAGGFEKLNESLSGFYENFYSSAEKTANLTRVLGTAFDKLGLSMPTDDLRAWYRGQVEAAMALDQAVPANQAYLASLLSVQSGVDQLSTSAETAAKEMADAAQKIADAAAKLQADIYSAQDDAMSEYMSAQKDYDSIVSGQADALASAAEALRDALASAGQGIVAFIQTLLNTPESAKSNYLTDLALARKGDVEASKRIPTSGRAYLDTQISSASTAAEARIAQARMAAELSTLPAVKAYEQQLLDAVNGVTGAVGQSAEDIAAALNAKLTAELTVSARSEILKLINFVANTDRLPADLKALALEDASTFSKAISFIQGSTLTPANMQLALMTATSVVKTYNFVAGSELTNDQKLQAFGVLTDADRTISVVTGSLLSDDAKQQAFDALQDATRTVKIVAESNALAEYKRVALEVTAEGTKVIRLAATDFSSRDAAVIIAATSSVTKGVALAIEKADPVALAILAAQSRAIDTMINASGGVLTEEQRALINGVDNYNKTITFSAVVDSSAMAAVKAAYDKLAADVAKTGVTAPAGTTVTVGNTTTTTTKPITPTTSAADVAAAAADSLYSTIRNVYNSIDAQRSAGKYTPAQAAHELASVLRDDKYKTLQALTGKSAVTMRDIAAARGQSYESVLAGFAAFGILPFAQGTNYLPADQLALVHQGERIIPAADNRELMARLQDPQQNSEALVTEVRALREENRAQSRAMVQMQQRLTKLMERWDSAGMPETRLEV